MFTKVIGISGRISSGKSTLSKVLKDKLNIPVVSFGKYLVDYSNEHGLLTDRESLQNLGNQMISNNAREFLDSVLEHASVSTGVIILEGIRHLIIWDEIKKISAISTLIFIETPFNLRWERFKERIKESDLVHNTLDHFTAMNSHQVEAEITDLKKVSNNIIDGSIDFLDSFSVKSIIAQNS